MTARTRLVAPLLVLVSGCFVHRLDRNALGDLDVRTPPANPAERAPVAPRDPGEQGLTISASGMAAVGTALAPRRDPRATHALGVAASVLYGTSRTTGTPASSAIWSRAGGLSVGWTAQADGRGAQVWVEGLAALRSSMLRAGAGWAWEARGGTSGPQASLHAGPLLLRGTYLRGEGTVVTLGVTIDPSYTVVWSR